MGLKLLQRGQTYYLRGTVRGQSIYETTGTSDKGAAEDIRIEREKQLLKESIHGKIATATFAEAAASYLDAGGSQRFLGEYDKSAGKWSGLIGHFGHRQLNSITQADLDLAANKLYPNTQWDTRNRQCHTPFIAVWNHACHHRWCEKRDWLRPRKPKGTKAKMIQKKYRAGTKPVSYEHAAKFVLAMSPAPAMLMTVLFYTGMRPIELFTLTAQDVDVAKRWISLDASKTDEPRGVPMHEVLVPLFTGLSKRKGLLFRTPRGKPYALKEDGGGQMKTAINGARKRSDIRDIAPYTGRHTVSTQLVLNGVHPYLKDQILGHATGSDMSRHYVNVPNAQCIEAINTLPTIAAWASAPWMHDPLAWERRLAEGTGRRTDLLREAA